jgi:hypothetical protein
MECDCRKATPTFITLTIDYYNGWFAMKFVVNSAILPAGMDPMACAVGTPKMLENAGIKNVRVKSCYCCGKEGKLVFVAEAESKESLMEALTKINMPVASIMETEEVTPKK